MSGREKCWECGGREFKSWNGYDRHRAKFHGMQPGTSGLEPTLEYRLWYAKHVKPRILRDEIKELMKRVKANNGNMNWRPR